MQRALINPHIIDIFKMTGLLHHIFFFNEQKKKYVSIYVNEDLKPQVKNGSFQAMCCLVTYSDSFW